MARFFYCCGVEKHRKKQYNILSEMAKEAFSPAVRRIKRKRRYMDGIYEFLSAALPWIAMGLLVAILAAKSAARKNKKESDREEDYGT